MEFKGVWSLRRKKWEGVEIWRNRRAARRERQTGRRRDGGGGGVCAVHGSSPPTPPPVKQCRPRKEVKTYKVKQSSATWGEDKRRLCAGAECEKNRKEKTTRAAAAAPPPPPPRSGHVLQCAAAGRAEGGFLIQRCFRRRLISAAYCQVEIRPTCKHI